MHIPFGDFKRQYIELQGEIDDAMRRVVQSGAYVLGPAVKAFEAEFAAYCEVPFSIGVGNGTDAIQLGLIAIGVRPGDEVITVANTGVPGVAGSAWAVSCLQAQRHQLLGPVICQRTAAD